MNLKAQVMAELTLECVKQKPIIPEHKLIMFDKDDGICYSKHGVSHKGLNRRSRRLNKIIERN